MRGSSKTARKLTRYVELVEVPSLSEDGNLLHSGGLLASLVALDEDVEDRHVLKLDKLEPVNEKGQKNGS
jgi:hypothetical protein